MVLYTRLSPTYNILVSSKNGFAFAVLVLSFSQDQDGLIIARSRVTVQDLSKYKTEYARISYKNSLSLHLGNTIYKENNTHFNSLVAKQNIEY